MKGVFGDVSVFILFNLCHNNLGVKYLTAFKQVTDKVFYALIWDFTN